MKKRRLVRVPVGGEIPGTVIQVLAGPVVESVIGFTGPQTFFYLEVAVED